LETLGTPDGCIETEGLKETEGLPDGAIEGSLEIGSLEIGSLEIVKECTICGEYLPLSKSRLTNFSSVVEVLVVDNSM